MRILGIYGVAGAGKDTAADYLVREYGFVKDSFAAPLKVMVKHAFNFTSDQLYGSQEEKERPDRRYPFSGICPSCGAPCRRREDVAVHMLGGEAWACHACSRSYPTHVSARLAMQVLGTEFGRRLYDNVWVDALITRCQKYRAPDVDLGHLGHIRATGEPSFAVADVRFENEVDGIREAGGKILKLKRGEVRFNHASETALANKPDDYFDHVIDNSGEKSFLYAQLSELVETWGWL